MPKLKRIINFITNPNGYPENNIKNPYFVLYHLINQFYKLFNIPKNNHGKDTFNWALYHLHYKGEVLEHSKKHTLTLKKNDYLFLNGKLVKNNNKIKPLHPDSHLLLEIILQLNPYEIFEMGCGNGVNLNNLQKINNNFKLSGVDISEGQIKYLRKLYPDLNATIIATDASKVFLDFQKADLAFTSAVLMHMHTEKSHLTALKNLFTISKKYVLLLEKWKNHNLLEDIKKLHSEGSIDWENIFFYYQKNETAPERKIMICSKNKLNYPNLIDYTILLN